MPRFILCVFFCSILNTVSAQELFKSEKYGYSFIIPNGWRSKQQIVLPETDAKIVDDRGNSFIVTVKPLPEEFKNVSAVELLSAASDRDLIDLWGSAYDNSYILRRGSTFLSGKEFYFVHMSLPFEGSLRLIHKMFMYNRRGYSVTIDCASISSMTAETSAYFDVMLNSLKLN